MNFESFVNAVCELNKDNYFYGNEILYVKAAESNLQKKEHLSGMMWLIGRSYAASPQRRSYGTKKEESWPVRPDNDGRDQFFTYISQKVAEKGLSYPARDNAYKFDKSDADWELLVESALAVLNLNLALSRAIEEFDYAPKGKACTNHISFCSKFLHFHFPGAVFIIDSYAQSGATRLFHSTKGSYICCRENADPLAMQTNTAKHLDKDVFDSFKKNVVKEYLEKLLELDAISDLLKDYKERKEDNAINYITHCVRSYLLGCALQDKGIALCNQTAGNNQPIYSWPRLIDTVFLNIKGKLTKDEAKRYLELLDTFGSKCDKYKELEHYRNLLEEIKNGS